LLDINFSKKKQNEKKINQKKFHVFIQPNNIEMGSLSSINYQIKRIGSPSGINIRTTSVNKKIDGNIVKKLRDKKNQEQEQMLNAVTEPSFNLKSKQTTHTTTVKKLAETFYLSNNSKINLRKTKRPVSDSTKKLISNLATNSNTNVNVNTNGNKKQKKEGASSSILESKSASNLAFTKAYESERISKFNKNVSNDNNSPKIIHKIGQKVDEYSD
jgi:hypothetical protein